MNRSVWKKSQNSPNWQRCVLNVHVAFSIRNEQWASCYFGCCQAQCIFAVSSLWRRWRLKCTGCWEEAVLMTYWAKGLVSDSHAKTCRPSATSTGSTMRWVHLHTGQPFCHTTTVIPCLQRSYDRADLAVSVHSVEPLPSLLSQVINFYMNLLVERSKDPGLPSVNTLNTFFYPKLCSSGYSAVRRWTKKMDIFSKDILLVPVHLGVHWCLSVSLNDHHNCLTNWQSVFLMSNLFPRWWISAKSVSCTLTLWAETMTKRAENCCKF